MMKRAHLVVVVALIISIIINAFFLIGEFKPRSEHHFLSPKISAMEKEDFAERQSKIQSNYFKLRELYIGYTTDEDISIYFEDLQTGAWVGINERKLYRGGSLLKVVTIATAIKALNDGILTLDQEVILKKEDLDPLYGSLYLKGAGSKVTIKDLIQYAAKNSDNTAANTLRSATGMDLWLETFSGLGHPLLNTEDGENYVPVNAKFFSNIFRNLYYSGYLNRDGSNYLLNQLSQTKFNDGIPKNLPPKVVVSHKIGTFTFPDGSYKNYHDCGIVYTKNKDYLLCIMTHDYDTEEAKKLIADISKITYDYVTSK
jgi:beta-lactamase class A